MASIPPPLLTAGAPLVPARLLMPLLAAAALAAGATSLSGRLPAWPWSRAVAGVEAGPATPPANGRALLSGLALDVPEDVADAPVTPVAQAPLTAAAPFSLGPAGAADVLKAEDCLTAAVYYEARSEQPDGQRAVAQVVLNRVRDRAFPRTVCGVVYQGAERRTGCQFSFTCDGSTARARDPAAWERARAVAAAALAGAVYAPVGSATHYHAASMLPWWAPSLARIGAVGAHIFYRWGGRLERALGGQSYAGAEPDAMIGGAAGGALGAAAAAGAGWDASGAAAGAVANALVAGVRVHRAGADAFGPAAPATGAVPAATPSPPDAVVRAGGVTVHRGGALVARFRGGDDGDVPPGGVRVHRGDGSWGGEPAGGDAAP